MVAVDPLSNYLFNPGQIRFINLCRNPCDSLTICEFLKGNGGGGSWVMVAIMSAIMFGTKNPLFAGFGPKQWKFIKDLRIVTTSESLTDAGPIQKAMNHLFPAGRWTQSRGVGKNFYSQGYTDTGFTWDIMTFNQSVTEFAAHTKGAIFISEPAPEPIFFEVCTRLRGHGVVFVEMTQLDMAGYNQDILENGLAINGRKIGEVRHTYMHHHEACAEHNIGGHRLHASIEADFALWLRQDPGVAEARASGKSLKLTGLIYGRWSDANELDALPTFHQQCWDANRVIISCVMDPHDRKPWAIAWFATFPNDDVVVFAEWPGFMFHEVKSSPINDPEDYRGIIMETEAEFYPVKHRRIDPNFGEAPKLAAGVTVKSMLSGPCEKCIGIYKKDGAREKCKHLLVFQSAPNDIPSGHIMVRAAIGNPVKGVRPKLYIMKASSPNMAYGVRHYAFKEQKDPKKALSEQPSYVFKDFPDLLRYFYNSGLDKWTEKPVAIEFYTPKVRGPGTTDI